MKKLVTEKIYQRVNRILDNLNRLCHHPDCELIDSCPGSHDECYRLLDIHTAVCWQLVSIVSSFIGEEVGSRAYFRDLLLSMKDETFEELLCFHEEIREVVDKLFKIVQFAFHVFEMHEDKYPEMYIEIERLLKVVKEIYKRKNSILCSIRSKLIRIADREGFSIVDLISYL